MIETGNQENCPEFENNVTSKNTHGGHSETKCLCTEENIVSVEKREEIAS